MNLHTHTHTHTFIYSDSQLLYLVGNCWVIFHWCFYESWSFFRGRLCRGVKSVVLALGLVSILFGWYWGLINVCVSDNKQHISVCNSGSHKESTPRRLSLEH